MTTAQALAERQDVPFVTDPEAAALFSLSQTERALAHRYRQWAEEATTAPERTKWLKEMERLWENAFWHLQRVKMYRSMVDG